MQQTAKIRSAHDFINWGLAIFEERIAAQGMTLTFTAPALRSEASSVLPIWDRVEKAAQAAALGTGTEVEWEIIHGNHPLLVNETLARMMDEKLRSVGGIQYTADEQGFAAFGRVVSGMDVVRRINGLPADAPSESEYTQGQILENPVTITRVRRAE